MENLELKNTTTEIKISLEGFNNRFELADERISELQYKSIEIMQSEE